MKTPDLPEEKPSGPNKRDFIMADGIKARIQAGEVVGALDYPEADRLLFWAAIARVRDDMTCVKPTWRTIDEQNVNGIRVRQKLFRSCPRQKGSIDATLAGLLALAGVCAVLLARGFL